MERELLGWIAQYGAPVLFAVQMFGIVGLPIPDELLLTIAGTMVRKGQLGALPTLAAAIGGCMSGVTVSYALGRSVGLPALRRVLRLDAHALDRAQPWFRRFGRWLIAFGYFVPGVRHVTAIAAGSTPLEFPVFAAYAYPGAAVWATTFVTLGYYAGDRWRELALAVRGHVTILGLALFGGLGVYTVLAARRRRP